MEMYNTEETGLTQTSEKVSIIYNKTKDWVSSFLGIIVTLISTAVVFYVTSVTGKIDAVEILKDIKFWILVGFTAITAIFSSYINFVSTIEQMKGTERFVKTLNYYSQKKKQASPYYQYIPDFCSYKTQQVYENAKRDIIESANIVYKKYIRGEVDYKSLERWQKRKLNKIKRIKVKRLTQSDLLQERAEDKTNVRILPISEDVKKRTFLAKTTGSRILTSFLSGFTMTLGITLGNWVLGITFAFSIIMASVLSTVQAVSFTQTGLRNRYIAKADLLEEFYNIKDKFIEEEAQNE